jgi:hypothetical protein
MVKFWLGCCHWVWNQSACTVENGWDWVVEGWFPVSMWSCAWLAGDFTKPTPVKTHNLNQGRPHTEPGTTKKPTHTSQSRVIFLQWREKTINSEQTTEVVRPLEFITSQRGTRHTTPPPTLHQGLLPCIHTYEQPEDCIHSHSSTIHPSFTLLLSLPPNPQQFKIFIK